MPELPFTLDQLSAVHKFPTKVLVPEPGCPLTVTRTNSAPPLLKTNLTLRIPNGTTTH